MLYIVGMIVVGALLFYFVIKMNNRSWEKQKTAWESHCNAFAGKVVSRYKWMGQVNGIPLHWRVYGIGGGGEIETREETFFEMYLQYPSGGIKWRVVYNVPGLLNHRPEGWTIETKDPNFEKALTQAGIKELAATLPRYSSARYNQKNGRLIYEARVDGMGYVPSIEGFTGIARSLEEMGVANQDLKNVAP